MKNRTPLGPKEVAWRLFGVVACIWGVATGAQLAVNALGRIWPLVLVAGVAAVAWLVYRRRWW